jgi:hypothetical protein
LTVTTGATLVVFFLVVLPGLIYESIRQVHRPSRSDSAFAEAGRVIVSGLVCGGVASALFASLRSRSGNGLASPSGLLTGMTYVTENTTRVFVSASVYMALVIGVALILAQTSPGLSGGRISSESAWVAALNRQPVNARAQAWIVMEGGEEIVGMITEYGTRQEVAGRELSLAPPYVWLDGNGKYRQVNGFDRILVRGDDVRALGIRWVPHGDDNASTSVTNRIVNARLKIHATLTSAKGSSLAGVCLLVATALLVLAWPQH